MTTHRTACMSEGPLCGAPHGSPDDSHGASPITCVECLAIVTDEEARTA